MDGLGSLKLTTRLLRTLLVSPRPDELSWSMGMMSTAAGEPATVRSVRRVPVTTMVWSGGTSAFVPDSLPAGGGGASWP